MRSDRNPYFLLRKSRDPSVQRWLAQAEQLSHEAIEHLSIKPDLKKAMHFVKRFGTDVANQTTADLIAGNTLSQQPARSQFEIYHYHGPEIELRCNARNSLILHDFLFMVDQGRILASHNWITVDPMGMLNLVKCSTRVGFGDQNHYNQLIQQHLSRKYSNL